MSATATERYLISRAVDAALCFGLGIMTTCREELEDKGIEWSDRLEKYVFDTYVESKYK
ncbi:MAG: hypothetical protein WC343_11125 [Bacilli bacterium]|jgi:hypothetical protein